GECNSWGRAQKGKGRNTTKSGGPAMTNDPNARSDRINGEMLDSIDEELEMEIDDDRLAKLLTEIAEHPQPETLDRRVYFKELLRLQGELVKLQDWVLRQKLKVVIIFEGRDAAGKGGGHQTDHTAPQSAHLPGRGAAGSERARTHPVVFPALPGPSSRRRDKW